MEWRKAREYVIWLLLAVNVILFCVNLYRANDTVVSASRIADITSILRSRDITLDCTLPNKYRPMAQLYMQNHSFDYIKLQNLFMSGKTDIKRTEKYNSVIFTSGDSDLTIKGGSIEYVDTVASPFGSLTEAEIYCKNITEKINGLFGDYVFYSSDKTDEGYSVKYYTSYDDDSVFSNFLYFTIKGTTINIALNYSDVIGSSGKKSIVGSDEAVFSAISAIKADYPQRCTISAVESGYYDSLLSSSDENYALPCYVIRAGGSEYFVNAYTGEML